MMDPSYINRTREEAIEVFTEMMQTCDLEVTLSMTERIGGGETNGELWDLVETIRTEIQHFA
jgi:hypothetical protein